MLYTQNRQTDTDNCLAASFTFIQNKLQLTIHGQYMAVGDANSSKNTTKQTKSVTTLFCHIKYSHFSQQVSQVILQLAALPYMPLSPTVVANALICWSAVGSYCCTVLVAFCHTQRWVPKLEESIMQEMLGSSKVSFSLAYCNPHLIRVC